MLITAGVAGMGTLAALAQWLLEALDRGGTVPSRPSSPAAPPGPPSRQER